MPTTPLGFPYPSYTDPADVPTDLQKLATAIDTKFTSDHTGRGSRVWQNIPQALVNGDFTKVAFDQVEHNINGMWDAGQQWMYALYSGIYLLNGRVEVQYNLSGSLRYFLQIGLGSGGTVRGPDIAYTTTGLNFGATVTTVQKVNAGNFFTLSILQTSNGAQMSAAGQWATWFECTQIG